MKKFLKLMSFALALSMIIPTLLASCSDKKTDGTNDLSSSESTITLLGEGKSDYVIVRPDIASKEIIGAATDLREAFNKKFGYSPDISSDYVKKDATVPTDTLEILIGATNRAETKEVMSSLNEGTFVIKVVNDRLVIVADTDVMVANAVEYFIETYIDPATDKVELDKDMIYIGNVSDYGAVKENEDGSVTLRLKNFVITYNRNNAQEFAVLMATAFAKRTESMDATLYSTEDKNENVYEILFGACEREDYVAYGKEFMFRDFYLYYKNNKLSVDAFSIYGYECAINFLCEKLEEGKLTVPADGLYVEYDYGEGTFAKVLRNYENQKAEGAWIVNMCHRGDVTTNNNPENSIPSYQSCIDNNIDIIETDLKKTRDGVWVICHDQTIDRTTTGGGPISSMTLERVQSYNLLTQNGGTGSTATEYHIPTLDDVIELCQGYVIFNLDHLTFDMFQDVYDQFEKYGAQDMAMFKGSCSAQEITTWFASLAEQGRKLPLYSPLCYSSNGSAIKSTLTDFEGLSSLIEMNYSGATDAQLQDVTAHAVQMNIRPLNMTIGSDNVETWTKLTANGYNAFMTDRPVELKNFIHGK